MANRRPCVDVCLGGWVAGTQTMSRLASLGALGQRFLLPRAWCVSGSTDLSRSTGSRSSRAVLPLEHRRVSASGSMRSPVQRA